MINNPSANPAKRLDWDELHRRLEAARVSLNREMPPDEEKRILKARAATLAKDSLDGETTEGNLEILEFLLAYERYGIEMSFVRETCPLRDLTPLPCTPPFVLGLINVRGEIVSVIDLKKFFDLPEKGLTDLNKVVIVHDDATTFGILADEIIGVGMVSGDAIQPSLPTLTGIRDEYLKGITGERTIILDGNRILTDRRLIVNDEE
ncbi:MAG: purine-binding chemotaxis protein CheW [Desulfuromonadales bacterium]|nr:MAG: purine-binding chemotaxis protein CheW [Desulfuromonadales bacterium]